MKLTSSFSASSPQGQVLGEPKLPDFFAELHVTLSPACTPYLLTVGWLHDLVNDGKWPFFCGPRRRIARGPEESM